MSTSHNNMTIKKPIAIFLTCILLSFSVCNVIFAAENNNLLDKSDSNDKILTQANATKYLDAYAAFLIDKMDNSFYPDAPDTPEFQLIFIDEDDVPELMYVEDSSHANGVWLYTYRNGSMINIGQTRGDTYDETDYGSNGECYYVPKKNIFLSCYEGMGSGKLDFYKITNNGQEQFIKGFSVDWNPIYQGDDLANYWIQNESISSVDASVSESVFTSQLKSIVNDYDFISTGMGTGIELTATNIDRMQNSESTAYGFNGNTFDFTRYYASDQEEQIEIDDRTFKQGLDYLLNETSPNEYNPELAYMLMALSDAAYNETKIQNAYESLGFNTIERKNYYENPFDLRYGLHNVAYTLGKKKQINGDGDILLISIRGSNEPFLISPDWQSDFTLGSYLSPPGTRVHFGFGVAADKLCIALENYIESNEFDKNTKIVITGHSRGAGVANLIEARIMDGSLKKLGVDIPDNAEVYGYNFACPDTMIFDLGNYSNEYDNIFNIANGLDPVSFVAGIIGDTVIDRLIFPIGYWGKYGKSYWFAEENDWKNVFESEMYLDGGAHDPGRYLKYLSNTGNSKLDKFKDRLSISGGTERKLAPIALAFFILCPADVTVTDENGIKLACVSENGVEYFTSDNPELFAFSYGDKKAFYYFGDKKLKVHITGTDSGSMEYKVANVNIVSKEIDKEKSFTNVNLFEGKIMESEVSVDDGIDDVRLFQTDSDNNVISEITTEGEEIKTYTIDSSAGTGGKITPSGAVYVNEGNSQEYDIVADEGYVIKDVQVDNTSVGALSSYTFTDVTSNHTITASFKRADSDDSEKYKKNGEDLLIPINTQHKATVDVKNVMLQYFTKHNPDATVKKMKFKSSNKKVVKVNKKGIAKGGKQSGTATITMYVKTLETVTKPNGKQKKKLSKWTVAGELTVNNKGK